MLNDSDRKILGLLADDGRLSWAEIAPQLGVTAPAIGDRVRKLEERGAILGYSVRLDPVQVGWALTSFVMVDLEHPRAKQRFMEVVRECPAIQECHHVTGGHDYLLKVRARSMADLENTVTNVLKGVDGVAKTLTIIALTTVKDEPLGLPQEP